MARKVSKQEIAQRRKAEVVEANERHAEQRAIKRAEQAQAARIEAKRLSESRRTETSRQAERNRQAKQAACREAELHKRMAEQVLKYGPSYMMHTWYENEEWRRAQSTYVSKYLSWLK